jgi:hypothetical protein
MELTNLGLPPPSDSLLRDFFFSVRCAPYNDPSNCTNTNDRIAPVYVCRLKTAIRAMQSIWSLSENTEYNALKTTSVVKYYKNATSKHASKVGNYIKKEELFEELHDEELNDQEPEESGDTPLIL